LLNGQSAGSCGWKTILSWYVIGDADKLIPPDIQLKFATRAKSRIYHVPGGDHPSMIAHPEVTVAAIRDAANAVDGGRRNRNSVADARRTMEDGHHLSSV
jgi:hypothetical protein